MTHRVLVTCGHLQRTIDRYRDFLQEHDIEVEMPLVEQQLSEDQLLEIIEEFDGVVAGDDQFTERVLSRGQRLRVVAKWGVGIDGIDLDAAKRFGIEVTNTPGAFGDEVADVAMGYVVSLARRLHEIDRAVRCGDWHQPPGRTLRGQTLGIVGLGCIGQALGRRARAFGMRLAGCDPQPPPKQFLEESDVQLLGLDELIPIADFLVLCCSANRDNVRLIDTDRLGRMKRGSFLVNVSRGSLVDEKALIEALSTGRLGGAALDVFQHEPLAANSPLRSFENCIFGSHNGSNTEQAVDRVNRRVLRQLVTGLQKETSP
ncbi:MAG: phosphoglycerate dehydrogenase [Thermoanaerobaculia bacterium]|nr:phosphoglycerate dehydrogenase [Thermoanaerobaculia bacterium]